jgi:hypothetical protein
MAIPEIQARLRRAFPEETDLATVRAIQQGIFLADDAIRNVPMLSTSIGRDYRGLIRRAGVMFSFEEACRRGDLPFTSKFRKMHRGHWHLLEISSGREHAQICRTADAEAFPEDGPVRQDERLANQFELFEELPPMPILLNQIRHLYVWLTFGADADGRLSHVCWTAPAREGKDWLGFANILRHVANSAENLTTAAPAPDPRRKLKFKEHIEATLDDSKNDKKSSA